MANVLDGLFGGLRRILLGGVEKPFHPALNITAPGATITEGVDGDGNPTTELDLSALSGGGGDISGPGTSVDGRFSLWVGTAGDELSVSAYTPASLLAAAAAAVPAAGGAPVTVTKAAASAGSGTAYSLANHKHDVDTAAPAAQAVTAGAAEGASTSLARADHTHSFTGTVGRWLTVDASGAVVDSDTALASKTISYSAADAVGASLTLRKSRGTSGAPSAHNAEDVLGSFVAQGRDGAAFFDAFKLQAVAEQAGGTGKRTRFESFLHNGTALTKGQSAIQVAATTTDATLTTVYTIALPADSIASVAIRWVGAQSASSNRAIRETTLVIRRSGSGDPVELGHVDGLPLYRDDSGWGDATQITYAINTGTDSIDIKVQGKAATTIAWVIDIVWAVR
jgi:hypothetical protein